FTTCGTLPINARTNCDGLNLAGIRFVRPIEGLDLTNGNGYDVDRDQYNLRLDHNFSSRHKISLVGTHEKTWGYADQAGRRTWPQAFDGLDIKRPSRYYFTFLSTLSSYMLNEVICVRLLRINYQ